MIRTLLVLFAAASLLPAADFKEFKKTVPLEPNGRFSLNTYKGSISISAWDQPQVDVQARIEPDPGWMSEPVDDVEIRVDAAAGSVHVKTEYHRHLTFMEGTLPNVRYTIRVPRGVSLSVKDYKSDADIAGVQGDVDFDTYKGTARIDGLKRGFQLKTYKGDVRVSFAAFTAHTHVDTYKGQIDMSIPRSSAFEVHAQLPRHATFQCDFPRTVHSSGHETEFRSVVNGGGPELRVSSYKGNIRLRAN